MHKILLVEDEAEIIRANKIILERRGGYEVETAINLTEARKKLLEFHPDLIVLDIMLPDGTGLEFLAELRQEHNLFMPVLILTALSDSDDIIRGLEAGGDDYISKPYDNKVLLARIKRMLERAHQIPEKLTLGRIKIDMDSKKAFVDDTDMGISITEFSLLALFLKFPGRVLSAGYLHEKIWGYESRETDNSLKIAISKLRTKLSGMNAGYTITFAHGEGYYLDNEEIPSNI